MADDALLGIDLGTSAVKAVLLHHTGRIAGIASASYCIDAPKPGWAEQDSNVWLRAVAAATRDVLERASMAPGRVAALSLSGQMHGLVCINAAGTPLRPAIIWADQRSVAEVEWIRRQAGAAGLAAWTGNPVDTGFMAPSWLWLRRHEPDVASRACTLLLPKDYVRFFLTGALLSEPSDAGSTGLFNPIAGAWSEPMMHLLAINPSLLPPIVASTAGAGTLAPAAAAAMGLRSGTPVIAGGGDQACQALGNGIIEPGDLLVTIGTGGQLLAPVTAPAVEPGLRLHLYNHVIPGLWWRMGAILAAGLAFRWLRDALFSNATFDDMARLAAQAPPGAEGLFFLPHLAGERTPHMDPSATGAFVGLSLRHRREHVVRAVMEGVVFALRQAFELMTTLGVQVQRVVASGGAAANVLWLQLLADIFGCPLYRTEQTEAAGTGAAMLAGIGSGLFTSPAEAVAKAVRWRHDPVSPGAAAAFYDRSYAIFKTLYPSLAAVRDEA